MKTIIFDPQIGKQLVFHAAPYVIWSMNDNKIQLRHLITKSEISLYRDEIAESIMSGELSFNDYPPTLTLPYLDLTQLSPEQRQKVDRRGDYCQAVLDAGRPTPKSRYLVEVIKETAERLGDANPPAPGSVYRWLLRYEKYGYDRAALAGELLVKRKRKHRLSSQDEELINTLLIEGRSRTAQLSVKTISKQINKHIDSRNVAASIRGEPKR